jgi:glycosyltransferase involved in cell wall biosynthesis
VKIALLAHAGSVHTRRWSVGLASRKHDIEILTKSSVHGYPEDITTHIMPGQSSLAYLRNIPRVRKILNRFAPDIVHAHYATGYGLWGFMQKEAPLIVTVWGTDIADALAGKFIIAPVVRRALKKARFVTAPSKFLLDQTLKFEPSVRDKLVQIPFGIKISAENTSAQRRDKIVRIIFSKFFMPNYAPEMVLRAFAGAVGKFEDMKLLMIGGGPLRKQLEKLAQALSVASQVEIRGWVDMHKAGELIKRSDIMVMPSYNESFGVAALEAAAAGVPVIATNVGGIPEIVENDYNGILISPGDEMALSQAMVRLADDAMMRRRMGEAGKKIAAERYDFEDCLDQMEDVYNQVAED